MKFFSQQNEEEIKRGDTEAKIYTCAICKEEFSNFRILGGHFTKAHPKQSDLYNRKMHIRSKRKPLREELKVAKRIYDM